MNRREVLDNKIRQNLHNEIEWMWEQYLDSGYPENPRYNFREFCQNVGYKMVEVRLRRDGRVCDYGNFVAR